MRRDLHELKTISAVLINKDAETLFGSNLDDFFVEYGDVWRGIKEYYNKHREMPTPEVVHEMFNHFKCADVTGAVEFYVDSLRAFYLKNKGKNIAMVADGLFEQAPAEEVIDALMAKLQELRSYSITATDHNIMDFDAAEERYEKVREKVAAMDGVPGIPSGVKTIDASYPTGWAGGDLIILLGYTGRKKSFFSALLACEAFQRGYKPMYVSLEMKADKVQDRIFTIMGSGMFQNSGLALGDIRKDSFDTFRETWEGKGEFIVVNSDGRAAITPNVLQAKIDQHKPSMLILDYAQLMSDNGMNDNMTIKMMNLSVQLKSLAVANDIPIILISSATPDGKVGDDPPTIEQVAWSKQLAFDADLAFAVHGSDEGDIVRIVCRKNRNGPQFDLSLDWDINNGIWKEFYIT
jgi:replicative DNA helicase